MSICGHASLKLVLLLVVLRMCIVLCQPVAVVVYTSVEAMF